MLAVQESLLYEYSYNNRKAYILADLSYYNPLRLKSWDYSVQEIVSTINPNKIIGLFNQEDYNERSSDTTGILLNCLKKSNIPYEGLISRKNYHKSLLKSLLSHTLLLGTVIYGLTPLIKIPAWEKLIGGIKIGAIFIKNKVVKTYAEYAIEAAQWLSNTHIMRVALFYTAQTSSLGIPFIFHIYNTITYYPQRYFWSDATPTLYWRFQRICVAIGDWGQRLFNAKIFIDDNAPVIAALLDFIFAIGVSHLFAKLLLPWLLKTTLIPFALQATALPILAAIINIAALSVGLYHLTLLTTKFLSSIALAMGFFQKASVNLAVDEVLLERHIPTIADYLNPAFSNGFNLYNHLECSALHTTRSVFLPENTSTLIILPPNILYGEGKLLQKLESRACGTTIKPCLFSRATQTDKVQVFENKNQLNLFLQQIRQR